MISGTVAQWAYENPNAGINPSGDSLRVLLTCSLNLLLSFLLASSFNLLLLPGDGIGVEVMGEVKKILDFMTKTGMAKFETETDLVGGAAYDAHKKAITDHAVEFIEQNHDAHLMAHQAFMQNPMIQQMAQMTHDLAKKVPDGVGNLRVAALAMVPARSNGAGQS